MREAFVATTSVPVGYTQLPGERGGVVVLGNRYSFMSQFRVFVLEEFAALWCEVSFATITAVVTDHREYSGNGIPFQCVFDTIVILPEGKDFFGGRFSGFPGRFRREAAFFPYRVEFTWEGAIRGI
jgi:hypothetical protein